MMKLIVFLTGTALTAFHAKAENSCQLFYANSTKQTTPSITEERTQKIKPQSALSKLSESNLYNWDTRNFTFDSHRNGLTYEHFSQGHKQRLEQQLRASFELDLMNKIFEKGYFQTGVKLTDYIEIALFVKDIQIYDDVHEEYRGSSDGWNEIWREHYLLRPVAIAGTLVREFGYVQSMETFPSTPPNRFKNMEITLKRKDGTIKKIRSTGDSQFFMARHLEP